MRVVIGNQYSKNCIAVLHLFSLYRDEVFIKNQGCVRACQVYHKDANGRKTLRPRKETT